MKTLKPIEQANFEVECMKTSELQTKIHQYKARHKNDGLLSNVAVGLLSMTYIIWAVCLLIRYLG